MEAGLYVVATPIGNLRDITLRALDVLAGASLVLAEDTRTTAKLLSSYGIEARTRALHDFNEDAATPEVLAAIEAGAAVALVSDAGTPLVSDPGFRLVRAAIAAGLRVIPLPGPSSVLAALVAAGAPTDRFMFVGFPPAKAAARRAFLQELRAIPSTLVFFESGPRLAESLADMAEILGDRAAAVARELTKLFEEVRRAPLAELAMAAGAGAPPKGELVVVVGPPAAEKAVDPEAIDSALRKAMIDHSLKDAAALVAEALGLSRKDAYARALALKDTP